MALQIETDRLFKEFSTLGVGGKIAYFARVKSLSELQEAFTFANENALPFFILGKGSNCLFGDTSYPGLVLLNKIDFCNWGEMEVHVGAGYSFSLLGSQSARKGLSGLEFASGIPASVGGAVFMNAGANSAETCDYLKSVTFLHSNGEIVEYSKEDLEFRYRYSSFHKMRGAIVSATFFFSGVGSDSKEKQLGIIEYRKKTQPLKDKSIGCIFRNPPGASAGALIDRCNLKGLSRGGAVVSNVHAKKLVF